MLMKLLQEFQYRKRYVLLQLNAVIENKKAEFQYRKRYVLLQRKDKQSSIMIFIEKWFQYRKRYVLLQLIFFTEDSHVVEYHEFQYRKRYVLLQQRVLEGQYSWGLKLGFGKPHTVNGQFGLPFDQKCR